MGHKGKTFILMSARDGESFWLKNWIVLNSLIEKANFAAF